MSELRVEGRSAKRWCKKITRVSVQNCEWDLAWNHCTSYSLLCLVFSIGAWNDLTLAISSIAAMLKGQWFFRFSFDTCLLLPVYCYIKENSSLSFRVENLLLFWDEHLNCTQIQKQNFNKLWSLSWRRICPYGFGRMFCCSDVGKSLKWSVRYFTMGYLPRNT